jgi:hypothetical protein
VLGRSALAAVASGQSAAGGSADRASRSHGRTAGHDVRLEAWQWAQDNGADGALPPGREIARQYGRHEHWGRLVKRSGLAGDLGA